MHTCNCMYPMIPKKKKKDLYIAIYKLIPHLSTSKGQSSV